MGAFQGKLHETLRKVKRFVNLLVIELKYKKQNCKKNIEITLKNKRNRKISKSVVLVTTNA